MVPAALGYNLPGQLGYLHPDYVLNWWWYELARVSYVGGQEYLRPRLLKIDYQYPVITEQASTATTADAVVRFQTEVMQLRSLLHRHEREQLWEYENRRSRSIYVNFYAPIINMLVDSVMRKPPVRRSTDSSVEDFWAAPDDKREQRMDTMMAHGLKWAQVYRIYHAVVDVRSVADGGDGKPYFYWVSPLDIVDWECDENGDYLWIKQFISANVTRTSWQTPYKQTFRYRIWARDTITTYEAQENGAGQTLIESRANTLGVVPFVPLYAGRNPDSSHPDGVSQMADLPKIANCVYNLWSLLLDQIYQQTFNILTFPDKKLDAIQIATNRFLGYDGQNTGGKPEYIAPDADQVRVILEVAGGLMELARQAVGVGRGRSESSKQQQSGEAMQLEDKKTETIMVDIASAGEDFERRLAKMVQRYKTAGATVADSETTIQYSREFDVRSLQADVMEATSLMGLGLPPEVKKALKLDIVQKKFASMDPEQLAGLLKAVETMTEPEPVAAPPNGQPPNGQPKNGAPPPKKADDSQSPA